MEDTYGEILRTLARPMEPEPTDEPAVLCHLSGIRAVLFDVYGTLFISGSGEVGTVGRNTCEEALAAALGAAEIDPNAATEGVQLLFQVIDEFHRESRDRGIDYPEVDVVQAWREVLVRLAARGLVEDGSWSDDELKRLAVEYEGRANPVWPMPGLRKCLSDLSTRDLVLGIVSNAQFYTRELFKGLLDGAPEVVGFDSTLQYYSYHYGEAKPGLGLHRRAAEALAERGIEAAEALYVGNDMLNDVYPAVQVGFRTALFAGDGRSLRLRRGEPRLDGIVPDLVIANLVELIECV